MVFTEGAMDKAFITTGSKSVLRGFYSQALKRPHRGVKLLTTSAGQNEHFQIGFVERYNQTICRATTVNIVAAQKQYGSTYKQKHWGYAMEYALIMRTYFPLKKYNYEATPYELLTGEKPDYHMCHSALKE